MTRIKAFRIKRLFTVVSVTGGFCELNCSHCGAKYIRSMLPAPGPRLPRLIERLHIRRGVRGFLLSGGWTREGVLPIEEHLDAIAELRRRYGLVFNAHLGLETRRDVLLKAREALDLVDFEFTLSEWMARGVRGLPWGAKRYLEALDAMLDAGLYVVPHVFLWHPGSSRELLEAELRALGDRGIGVVNLLVYIPPEGDIDWGVAEMLPGLLRWVRSRWEGELYLGCMRPPAARRVLDPVAVGEGLVDRIANPSLAATRAYRDRLEFYDSCCSVPADKLRLFGPLVEAAAART